MCYVLLIIASMHGRNHNETRELHRGYYQRSQVESVIAPFNNGAYRITTIRTCAETPTINH